MWAIAGGTDLLLDVDEGRRSTQGRDQLAGNHLYCTGKKMEPGQLACAHRTLPCGTVVMLENPRTGRFGVCQVLDRGPFGAKLDTGDDF